MPILLLQIAFISSGLGADRAKGSTSSAESSSSAFSQVQNSEDAEVKFDDPRWKPILERLQKKWVLSDSQVRHVKEVLLDQMRQLKVMREDLELSDTDRKFKEKVLMEEAKGKIVAILRDSQGLKELGHASGFSNTSSFGSGAPKIGGITF